MPGTRMGSFVGKVLASTVVGLATICAGCLAQPGEPNELPRPPVVIPIIPGKLICEHPEVPATAFTPSRLMTRFEYDNTVRDLLGLPASMTPSSGFPAENRVNGFDNNAVAHVVSPLLVTNYIDAAEALSALALTSNRAALVPCDPAVITPNACGRQVIARLVPRAFRRPATPEETTALERFFDQALIDDDFDTAVRLVVQAILQSPQFLYRLEPGDPSVPGGQLMPLIGYPLAARLSYFLWGSGPDDLLLAAVADGSLDTTEGYRLQVQRMIADRRTRAAVRHFHTQWIETEKLATVTKDVRTFPDYDPALRASWAESVGRFVDDAYWNGGGLSAFLNDPGVWVDGPLARSLGYPAPPNGEWKKMDRDPTIYAGILTQPGIMAALALPNQGSPIRRGVFVRERLLCQTMPLPPPDVPTMPPDPAPNLTTRERFKAHTAAEYCRGCHVRIDPIGFALESFDGLGRFRATEAGKTIDVSGELRFLRDASAEGTIDGAVGLANKLAALPEVSDCVAKQWFRYAIGREVQTADNCSLVNVETAFVDSHGDFEVMLAAIAETDAFRYRVVGAGP